MRWKAERRPNLSVHKHTYRAYTGPVTPPKLRSLVLARYGLAEAWSSKITVSLLVICLVPLLVFLVGIYVADNPIARMLIFKGMPAATIDEGYFLRIVLIQSWLAVVLCAWVAPRLISFDLADNALPIVLSHPISRPGYVLGKVLALLVFLSAVTWVPALLLFGYAGYAAPGPWLGAHRAMASGLLVGSLVWIVFLSMLGLALSAWVKWRVVATGLIFASIFVSAAVGSMMKIVLRTRWGLLLNLPVMLTSLWRSLLGLPAVGNGEALPVLAILLALVLACVGFVAMLNARIRARGVVRG